MRVALEDDSMLLGKSGELLSEDVFEFLDCGYCGLEPDRAPLHPPKVDGLIHSGQGPGLFDFVPAHRGDFNLSGEALGLLPGSRLRSVAHTIRTPWKRSYDPLLPATAATPHRNGPAREQPRSSANC